MKSTELPSRIDRLEIVLAPDRVSIVFHGKGLKPVPQLLAELTCAPFGDDLWQAAIAALAQWLEDTPAASRAGASIRLSSRFVRYVMLPWSEDLTGRKEEQTLARIVYEGIYGEAANGWNIAIARASYGEPCLMVAIDQTLLTAIQALFPSKRLRTVYPTLADSLVACHDKLPAGEAQLAIIEDGVLIFLGAKDKKIRSVKRVLAEPADMVELPALIQREALLNGYDLKTVSLCYSIQSDGMGPIKLCPPLIELPRSSEIPASHKCKRASCIDLEWRSGRSRAGQTGSILLALSVAVLVGVLGRQTAMLKEAEGLQMQIDAHNARPSRVPVTPEADAARRKIEEINARLTFPWDRLLKMLESSAGEDVALLVVEPDTTNHQVKLEAEARNWAAMIEYIGKLDSGGAFSKASLISHQTDKTNPQMPIRFVLLCELRVNPAVSYIEQR